MGDWRYTLEEGYSRRIPQLAGLLDQPLIHEWFTLSTDGTIYIKPEYAWDGATMWPDGPRMSNPPNDFKIRFSDPTDYIRVLTRGTLIHDLMYQFMEVIAEATGLKAKEVRLIADIALAVIARADGAEDWLLVKIGVRLLGGVYHGTRKLFRKLLWWKR